MNYTPNIERMTVLFSLMDALRTRDNWCGETHVQKSAFFLDELTGRSLGYDFILYKHGPFSFNLNEELSFMTALGWVQDEILNPRYGPRLRPNEQFKDMLLTDFGAKAKQVTTAVQFLADRLANYGVATLERLGTALFFTKREPVADAALRARRITEVKSHVSMVLALNAVKTVDEILHEWEKRRRCEVPEIEVGATA